MKISQFEFSNNPKLAYVETYSNNLSLAQMLQLVNYLPTLTDPSEYDGILAVVSSANDGNDISDESQEIKVGK